MKYLFISLFLLILTGTANASWWYLVNEENHVVAKQNGEPKIENLEKDGFFAIKSEVDIDLFKAEYKNGKIVEHKKTTAELKTEQDKIEKEAEEKLIQDRMKKKIISELKAEGKVFKHIKPEDFE